MAHSNSPVSTTNAQIKPFKTYAIASARLYQKQFSDPDHQWTYCEHKGVLAFGRERSNLGGANPSTSIGHGAAESENYWFRLTSEGRLVWTFKLPAPFEYRVDKPFFHVFSGNSRLLAFRFDEDHEAAIFCKKVQDRTCPHRRSTSFSLVDLALVCFLLVSSPRPKPWCQPTLGFAIRAHTPATASVDLNDLPTTAKLLRARVARWFHG